VSPDPCLKWCVGAATASKMSRSDPRATVRCISKAAHHGFALVDGGSHYGIGRVFRFLGWRRHVLSFRRINEPCKALQRKFNVESNICVSMGECPCLQPRCLHRPWLWVWAMLPSRLEQGARPPSRSGGGPFLPRLVSRDVMRSPTNEDFSFSSRLDDARSYEGNR
jgi:hypothetical protein